MQKVSGKRKAIPGYKVRSNDGTTFRFWPVIKNVSRKKRQEKMGISDVCHKCGTPVHKTNHQRYSRRVQKALAHREQLQISRTDTCPHMQPKSCDQNLYVLSLHDCVQFAVCGSVKNEQGNRDQTWAAHQKKYGI